MSDSKSVTVDGNLDGESVHQLSIVSSEKKQRNGGPGQSVNVDGNPRGETVHQLRIVASEIKQEDGGPGKNVTVDGNPRGESVHQRRIVASEINQEDVGPRNSAPRGVAALDPFNPSEDESEKESHINDNSSMEDDPLIGQRVYGIVERKVEGQGCVITVRVGESEIYLRGAVFPNPRSQVKKKRRIRYII